MNKLILGNASYINHGDDWSEFKKWIDGTYSYLRYTWIDEVDSYNIIAVDDRILRIVGINKSNTAAISEFEMFYKTMKPIDKLSDYNLPVVENTIRSGNKTQQISQNFCDKQTWYTSSERKTGIQMVDSGDGYVWNLPNGTLGSMGIVDVSHGRILHERRIRSTYKVRVYVNGVEKTEKDVHSNVGDFTINYITGDVTFDVNQSGNTVIIDYSEVKNSKWYLRPAEGKKLRLVSAELQFSTDAQMKDNFIFQMYAQVDKFPPLFPYWDENPLGAPGPYPAGTKIPIGDTVVYQTVFDLICEANLAYPVIPKWQGQGNTWRDLKSDVMIFSWQYGDQASIDIDSAYGMEIEIRLEHDTECDGSYSVVTFYCTSERS